MLLLSYKINKMLFWIQRKPTNKKKETRFFLVEVEDLFVLFSQIKNIREKNLAIYQINLFK